MRQASDEIASSDCRGLPLLIGQVFGHSLFALNQSKVCSEGQMK